jgi:hypothetical protein
MTNERPEPEHHGALYRDRTHAGECLAARLDAYRDTGALVLSIPRGGVPVAAEWLVLEADLDVVVARPRARFPGVGHRRRHGNGGQFNGTSSATRGIVRLPQADCGQMADARRREERFAVATAARPHRPCGYHR